MMNFHSIYTYSELNLKFDFKQYQATFVMNMLCIVKHLFIKNRWRKGARELSCKYSICYLIPAISCFQCANAHFASTILQECNPSERKNYTPRRKCLQSGCQQAECHELECTAKLFQKQMQQWLSAGNQMHVVGGKWSMKKKAELAQMDQNGFLLCCNKFQNMYNFSSGCTQYTKFQFKFIFNIGVHCILPNRF